MYVTCSHTRVDTYNLQITIKDFEPRRIKNSRREERQKRRNSEKSFATFLFQHYHSRENRDSASRISPSLNSRIKAAASVCVSVVNEMHEQRWFSRNVRPTKTKRTSARFHVSFENQMETLRYARVGERGIWLRDSFLFAWSFHHTPRISKNDFKTVGTRAFDYRIKFILVIEI